MAEAAKPRKATFGEWVTLARLCAPDKLLVLFSFVMLCAAAAGEILMPQLQAAALNLALAEATPRAAQVRAVIQLAVAGSVTALFTGLRGFAFWKCGANLVYRLRESLFGALLRLPQSFLSIIHISEPTRPY